MLGGCWLVQRAAQLEPLQSRLHVGVLEQLLPRPWARSEVGDGSFTRRSQLHAAGLWLAGR